MKRYIKSTVDNSLLISDFVNILKDIYTEKFPHSKCDVWFSNHYSMPEVFIRCYLGNDYNDWASRIDDNDLFYIRVAIEFQNAPENLTEDDYVPNTCKLRFVGNSIKIVPEDDWYWCDYHTLKLRSVSGDAQKMIKAWEKVVNTLYTDTVALYREGKLHKQTIQYYDIEEKLSLK